MINKKSVDTVESSNFSKSFCKPLYDSYSFSNIIGTVEKVLTGSSDRALPEDVLGNLGEDYEKVVLLFVDALGWRFIEPRLKTSKVVKALAEKGVLSKLTATFPSTTSAAVPTLNTGLDPIDTGLIEWRQYNDKADGIIIPIKFKHGYHRSYDLKTKYGLEPSDIYPEKNVYQKLASKGIKSVTYLGDSYADSDYNKTLMKGSEVFGYLTLNEGLYALSEKIINAKEGKYFLYLYLNCIDDIAHKYGAGSKELDLEIDNVLRLIDELILQKTEGKAGKTLLLITADHGHDVFDPDETFYINRQIPEFEKYLAINASGESILPSGSAKDVFLHIQPQYLEEARVKLEDALKGIAEVYLSKDILAQGFFGRGEATEKFKKIIGDIVLLPLAGQSIWWYQGEKILKQSKGQHGGLSRGEMEIPLFAYPL